MGLWAWRVGFGALTDERARTVNQPAVAFCAPVAYTSDAPRA